MQPRAELIAANIAGKIPHPLRRISSRLPSGGGLGQCLDEGGELATTHGGGCGMSKPLLAAHRYQAIWKV
jgi:hypothetical protein